MEEAKVAVVKKESEPSVVVAEVKVEEEPRGRKSATKSVSKANKKTPKMEVKKSSPKKEKEHSPVKIATPKKDVSPAKEPVKAHSPIK